MSQSPHVNRNPSGLLTLSTASLQQQRVGGGPSSPSAANPSGSPQKNSNANTNTNGAASSGSSTKRNVLHSIKRVSKPQLVTLRRAYEAYMGYYMTGTHVSPTYLGGLPPTTEDEPLEGGEEDGVNISLKQHVMRLSAAAASASAFSSSFPRQSLVTFNNNQQQQQSSSSSSSSLSGQCLRFANFVNGKDPNAETAMLRAALQAATTPTAMDSNGGDAPPPSESPSSSVCAYMLRLFDLDPEVNDVQNGLPLQQFVNLIINVIFSRAGTAVEAKLFNRALALRRARMTAVQYIQMGGAITSATTTSKTDDHDNGSADNNDGQQAKVKSVMPKQNVFNTSSRLSAKDFGLSEDAFAEEAAMIQRNLFKQRHSSSAAATSPVASLPSPSSTSSSSYHPYLTERDLQIIRRWAFSIATLMSDLQKHMIERAKAREGKAGGGGGGSTLTTATTSSSSASAAAPSSPRPSRVGDSTTTTTTATIGNNNTVEKNSNSNADKQPIVVGSSGRSGSGMMTISPTASSSQKASASATTAAVVVVADNKPASATQSVNTSTVTEDVKPLGGLSPAVATTTTSTTTAANIPAPPTPSNTSNRVPRPPPQSANANNTSRQGELTNTQRHQHSTLKHFSESSKRATARSGKRGEENNNNGREEGASTSTKEDNKSTPHHHHSRNFYKSAAISTQAALRAIAFQSKLVEWEEENTQHITSAQRLLLQLTRKLPQISNDSDNAPISDDVSAIQASALGSATIAGFSDNQNGSSFCDNNSLVSANSSSSLFAPGASQSPSRNRFNLHLKKRVIPKQAQIAKDDDNLDGVFNLTSTGLQKVETATSRQAEAEREAEEALRKRKERIVQSTTAASTSTAVTTTAPPPLTDVTCRDISNINMSLDTFKGDSWDVIANNYCVPWSSFVSFLIDSEAREVRTHAEKIQYRRIILPYAPFTPSERATARYKHAQEYVSLLQRQHRAEHEKHLERLKEIRDGYTDGGGGAEGDSDGDLTASSSSSSGSDEDTAKAEQKAALKAQKSRGLSMEKMRRRSRAISLRRSTFVVGGGGGDGDTNNALLALKAANGAGGGMTVHASDGGSSGEVIMPIPDTAEEKALPNTVPLEYRHLHKKSATTCAFNPAATAYVTGGEDGLVKRWCASTGAYGDTIYNAGFAWILALEFLTSKTMSHFGGDLLAVVTSNNQVTIINTSSSPATAFSSSSSSGTTAEQQRRPPIIRKYVGSNAVETAIDEVPVLSTVTIRKYGMKPGESGARKASDWSVSGEMQLTREQYIRNRREELRRLTETESIVETGTGGGSEPPNKNNNNKTTTSDTTNAGGGNTSAATATTSSLDSSKFRGGRGSIPSRPILGLSRVSCFVCFPEAHGLCVFGTAEGTVGTIDLYGDVTNGTNHPMSATRQYGTDRNGNDNDSGGNNAAASAALAPLHLKKRAHKDVVTGITFAPRYNTIISVSLDGQVGLLKLTTGVFMSLAESIPASLGTGGLGGTMRYHGGGGGSSAAGNTFNTSKHSASFSSLSTVEPQKPILGICWCERLQLFATFSSDRRIRLWNLLRPDPAYVISPALPCRQILSATVTDLDHLVVLTISNAGRDDVTTSTVTASASNNPDGSTNKDGGGGDNATSANPSSSRRALARAGGGGGSGANAFASQQFEERNLVIIDLRSNRIIKIISLEAEGVSNDHGLVPNDNDFADLFKTATNARATGEGGRGADVSRAILYDSSRHGGGGCVRFCAANNATIVGLKAPIEFRAFVKEDPIDSSSQHAAANHDDGVMQHQPLISPAASSSVARSNTKKDGGGTTGEKRRGKKLHHRHAGDDDCDDLLSATTNNFNPSSAFVSPQLSPDKSKKLSITAEGAGVGGGNGDKAASSSPTAHKEEDKRITVPSIIAIPTFRNKVPISVKIPMELVEAKQQQCDAIVLQKKKGKEDGRKIANEKEDEEEKNELTINADGEKKGKSDESPFSEGDEKREMKAAESANNEGDEESTMNESRPPLSCKEVLASLSLSEFTISLGGDLTMMMINSKATKENGKKESGEEKRGSKNNKSAAATINTPNPIASPALRTTLLFNRFNKMLHIVDKKGVWTMDARTGELIAVSSVTMEVPKLAHTFKLVAEAISKNSVVIPNIVDINGGGRMVTTPRGGGGGAASSSGGGGVPTLPPILPGNSPRGVNPSATTTTAMGLNDSPRGDHKHITTTANNNNHYAHVKSVVSTIIHSYEVSLGKDKSLVKNGSAVAGTFLDGRSGRRHDASATAPFRSNRSMRTGRGSGGGDNDEDDDEDTAGDEATKNNNGGDGGSAQHAYDDDDEAVADDVTSKALEIAPNAACWASSQHCTLLYTPTRNGELVGWCPISSAAKIFFPLPIEVLGAAAKKNLMSHPSSSATGVGVSGGATAIVATAAPVIEKEISCLAQKGFMLAVSVRNRVFLIRLDPITGLPLALASVGSSGGGFNSGLHSSHSRGQGGAGTFTTSVMAGYGGTSLSGTLNGTSASMASTTTSAAVTSPITSPRRVGNSSSSFLPSIASRGGGGSSSSSGQQQLSLAPPLNITEGHIRILTVPSPTSATITSLRIVRDDLILCGLNDGMAVLCDLSGRAVRIPSSPSAPTTPTNVAAAGTSFSSSAAFMPPLPPSSLTSAIGNSPNAGESAAYTFINTKSGASTGARTLNPFKETQTEEKEDAEEKPKIEGIDAVIASLPCPADAIEFMETLTVRQQGAFLLILGSGKIVVYSTRHGNVIFRFSIFNNNNSSRSTKASITSSTPLLPPTSPPLATGEDDDGVVITATCLTAAEDRLVIGDRFGRVTIVSVPAVARSSSGWAAETRIVCRFQCATYNAAITSITVCHEIPSAAIATAAANNGGSSNSTSPSPATAAESGFDVLTLAIAASDDTVTLISIVPKRQWLANKANRWEQQGAAVEETILPLSFSEDDALIPDQEAMREEFVIRRVGNFSAVSAPTTSSNNNSAAAASGNASSKKSVAFSTTNQQNKKALMSGSLSCISFVNNRWQLSDKSTWSSEPLLPLLPNPFDVAVDLGGNNSKREEEQQTPPSATPTNPTATTATASSSVANSSHNTVLKTSVNALLLSANDKRAASRSGVGNVGDATSNSETGNSSSRRRISFANNNGDNSGNDNNRTSCGGGILSTTVAPPPSSPPPHADLIEEASAARKRRISFITEHTAHPNPDPILDAAEAFSQFAAKGRGKGRDDKVASTPITTPTAPRAPPPSSHVDAAIILPSTPRQHPSTLNQDKLEPWQKKPSTFVNIGGEGGDASDGGSSRNSTPRTRKGRREAARRQALKERKEKCEGIVRGAADGNADGDYHHPSQPSMIPTPPPSVAADKSGGAMPSLLNTTNTSNKDNLSPSSVLQVNDSMLSRHLGKRMMRDPSSTASAPPPTTTTTQPQQQQPPAPAGSGGKVEEANGALLNTTSNDVMRDCENAEAEGIAVVKNQEGFAATANSLAISMNNSWNQQTHYLSNDAMPTVEEIMAMAATATHEKDTMNPSSAQTPPPPPLHNDATTTPPPATTVVAEDPLLEVRPSGSTPTSAGEGNEEEKNEDKKRLKKKPILASLLIARPPPPAATTTTVNNHDYSRARASVLNRLQQNQKQKDEQPNLLATHHDKGSEERSVPAAATVKDGNGDTEQQAEDDISFGMGISPSIVLNSTATRLTHYNEKLADPKRLTFSSSQRGGWGKGFSLNSDSKDLGSPRGKGGEAGARASSFSIMLGGGAETTTLSSRENTFATIESRANEIIATNNSVTTTNSPFGLHNGGGGNTAAYTINPMLEREVNEALRLASIKRSHGKASTEENNHNFRTALSEKLRESQDPAVARMPKAPRSVEYMRRVRANEEASKRRYNNGE